MFAYNALDASRECGRDPRIASGSSARYALGIGDQARQLRWIFAALQGIEIERTGRQTAVLGQHRDGTEFASPHGELRQIGIVRFIRRYDRELVRVDLAGSTVDGYGAANQF